jgi:hypothetical protein
MLPPVVLDPFTLSFRLPPLIDKEPVLISIVPPSVPLTVESTDQTLAPVDEIDPAEPVLRLMVLARPLSFRLPLIEIDPFDRPVVVKLPVRIVPNLKAGVPVGVAVLMVNPLVALGDPPLILTEPRVIAVPEAAFAARRIEPFAPLPFPPVVNVTLVGKVITPLPATDPTLEYILMLPPAEPVAELVVLNDVMGVPPARFIEPPPAELPVIVSVSCPHTEKSGEVV